MMIKPLDLRQERCPLTFVRVRLLLESLPIDGTGELWLGKEEDASSIRQSLESEGHLILEEKNEMRYVRLFFRKMKED